MTLVPDQAYDYLALARRRLFDQVRLLAGDEYTREFPFGHRSLRRTLTHIMVSEWYYVQRICGNDVPPYETWPLREENPPVFSDLEAAWTRLAAQTREALKGVGEWDQGLEYVVTDDAQCRKIVSTTAGELFMQLLCHEVHHRAQAMAMLSQLGRPTGDLDFNALMFKRRDA
ncbi:MAG TPA: DinB family protein [Planctomycetota bacterium]|nr:DinB family protein [Planctomycetota bacterium]